MKTGVLLFVPALVLACGVASANPATPLPVIEDNARVFCDAVNADPTEGGVFAGMDLVGARGLDDMDQAYTLISAVHHVCPQHEQLFMTVAEQFSGAEGCKPS